MLEHQHGFSVTRMAMVLRVSRSGYYDWCKNGSKPSNRALKQQSRDMKIKELFDDSKGRYGATRIQKDLAEDGAPAAIKTIRESKRWSHMFGQFGGWIKLQPFSYAACLNFKIPEYTSPGVLPSKTECGLS